MIKTFSTYNKILRARKDYRIANTLSEFEDFLQKNNPYSFLTEGSDWDLYLKHMDQWCGCGLIWVPNPDPNPDFKQQIKPDPHHWYEPANTYICVQRCFIYRCKSPGPRSTFSIQHGDFHFNNLMFKKTETGQYKVGTAVY